MKFHCDSCNTRYSIADERVRGKILKIRCKSCSAVITVREDAEPAAGPPGKGSSSAAAPAGDAAADVAWYLSLNGDQVGPLSLPAARAWLAKQAPGSDVFCWYDGFGDWKSVRQVSAFAGALKGAPSRPAARPSRPPTDRAATEVPSLQTPRPQTPGGANRLRPGAPVRQSGAQRSSSAAASPTAARRPASPAGASPASRNTPAPKATPSPVGSKPPTPTRRDRTPAPAPRRPQTPKSPAGFSRPATPSPALPTAPARKSAPASLSKPVAPAPVTPAPVLAKPTPAAGPPIADARLGTVPSEPPAHALELSPPAPGLEPAARKPPEPQRIALAPEVRPTNDPFANVPDNDDLDLDIGEPSRVVKLDVLMASRQVGGAAHMPGPGLPGVKRATMGVPALKSDAPSGPNPAPAFPDLAEELEQESLEPIALPTRKRSSALVLAIVALLFIGAGTIAFLALNSGDSDKNDSLAGQNPDEYSELGRQIDRPGRRAGDPDGTDVKPENGNSGPNVKKKNPRRRDRDKVKNGKSRNGSNNDQNPNNGNGSQNGSNTSNGSNDPLTPLSPDDVIRKSNRSQISFKRCYERAKKKDPFLEVSGIKIELKVDKSGAVSNIKLSNMDGTYLGGCLTGTVKKWKFRPSTEGINTQLSVKFGR